MTTVLEPIGAGIVVALINKFIINNNLICQLCSGCRAQSVETLRQHEDDCTSSTSTTAVDTVEVHAHF